MAKLTLSIEPKIIERAKQYAKDHHTSLSKLIQKYLQDVAEQKKISSPQEKLEDLPDWLKDIIPVTTPTPDFDHRAEYGKHLEDKYGI
ncbi:hypothetical protein DJ568_06560 [Mucilaginibacter hurinus]|uniref:Antitoxin n=1 Tax=Mucilaginibacter hurinus TaxID=2201324 RepID=A0A367GR54_9SPHI|nr:DUF6364 family protein [Mucilaginibacter hurinus]RCH55548.1 hypothetical protein DJ568_06560 [Mucilaginibacter hurinus]